MSEEIATLLAKSSSVCVILSTSDQKFVCKTPLDVMPGCTPFAHTP